MSTKKPTAAESAKWHREQAEYHGSMRDQWARDSQHMRRRRDANVQKLATLAAHHESAAEALDLLAELAATYPKTLAITLTDEHDARLRALVEGR